MRVQLATARRRRESEQAARTSRDGKPLPALLVCPSLMVCPGDDATLPSLFFDVSHTLPSLTSAEAGACHAGPSAVRGAAGVDPRRTHSDSFFLLPCDNQAHHRLGGLSLLFRRVTAGCRGAPRSGSSFRVRRAAARAAAWHRRWVGPRPHRPMPVGQTRLWWVWRSTMQQHLASWSLSSASTPSCSPSSISHCRCVVVVWSLHTPVSPHPLACRADARRACTTRTHAA